MTVLGISANSRVVGIAIIGRSTLLDYNVHYYKEAWSQTKVTRIIGCLKQHHRRHQITHIAIAIPHAHYQNKETRALILLIRNHCLKKGIPITPYDPEAIHHLHQGAKAKKKAMMAHLSDCYPELAPLFGKELRNRRRYYFKLFEAVAAARLLSIELANGTAPEQE